MAHLIQSIDNVYPLDHLLHRLEGYLNEFQLRKAYYSSYAVAQR